MKSLPNGESAENWVAIFIVDDFQRPCLTIEEIKNDDGSFSPGRQAWSAVEFSYSEEPFEYAGKNFDRVHLSINDGSASPKEKWTFFNARIAAAPGTGIKETRFVMIYDSCRRGEWHEQHEPQGT
jgi:hypothetical protein